MLRRSLATLTLGCWAGLCAGVATALADFGAHWLFMDSAVDRAWLGVRLVSVQVAAGVVMGGLLACMVSGATAIGRRAQPQASQRKQLGLRAGLLTLALSPALAALAQLLWSGGTMSRIGHHALWVALSGCALGVGLFGAIYVACSLLELRHPLHSRRMRGALLALLAAAFGLGKLNQHVLPNLYDYLHATLSLTVFSLYTLTASLAGLAALRAHATLRRWLWLSLPIPGLAVALGVLSVATLEQNQNVRVALLSSHMPSSRALLQALTPVLPAASASEVSAARQHAVAARARRARAGEAVDLPEVPDAHILLISVDALRADHLGTYGYTRATTPELDALAKTGVLFEHAYAQAPHSSYSLCSLMTSEYLHETTELGFTPPELTLPRVLADSGYHTAAFYTQGIFHTAAEQLGRYEHDAFGFALHDHQDRPAEQMTDRALEEVDRTLTRGEPSSLFWVHYFDVHEPYEATTLGTRDIDRYDSELLATDAAIGRLVRSVRERLTKPLIVVVTADHGEEFHEHGGVYHGSSLYEEQVHVPLLIVVPGSAPRRVAQPVELGDVAPTLLALVDVERPAGMRGSDLRSLWTEHPRERGPVFSAVIHKKMVVSWPYKLIADLRFGAFELYNLREDPLERENRADREPERVRALRGEVYAWLDSLAPKDSTATRAAQALEWGRLGDRRAVLSLSDLVGDDSAAAGDRCEAARLLGKLADPATSDSLLSATHARDPWVAAESAIALGRMFDDRAGGALRRLVRAEDPGVRSRAAVSLGRLRDKTAVPALIDALWVAPNLYEREEAVRWLGRLRDPSALDALINLLPETHTRHLVVVALGELGDARAFVPLVQVLESDRNTNVRDGVVRGLAMLGDPRALPIVLPLVAADPALRNTGEALVRLHALEHKLIAGVDLEAGARGVWGFTRCQSGPWRHDWDFLHRTHCETERDRAGVKFPVPARVADNPQGSTLVIELRRVDASAGVPVELRVAGRSIQLQVDGVWRDVRVSLERGEVPRGPLRVELRAGQPDARLDVDHVLLVPQLEPKPALASDG